MLIGLAALRAPATAAAQTATLGCGEGRIDLASAHPGFETAAAVAADSFAALFAREPAAGAAIAVDVRGRLAWSATLGLADVEADRPVCSDTRFRTGSVSKVLTALALLRLVDVGMIELDADVRHLGRRACLPAGLSR